uniref:Uncharacterized protein n=1 Tax=Glossina brevipalpis TaxID=37001 RepID=A0A1A9W9S6_9MUSC
MQSIFCLEILLVGSYYYVFIVVNIVNKLFGYALVCLIKRRRLKVYFRKQFKQTKKTKARDALRKFTHLKRNCLNKSNCDHKEQNVDVRSQQRQDVKDLFSVFVFNFSSKSGNLSKTIPTVPLSQLLGGWAMVMSIAVFTSGLVCIVSAGSGRVSVDFGFSVRPETAQHAQ